MGSAAVCLAHLVWWTKSVHSILPDACWCVVMRVAASGAKLDLGGTVDGYRERQVKRYLGRMGLPVRSVRQLRLAAARGVTWSRQVHGAMTLREWVARRPSRRQSLALRAIAAGIPIDGRG